MPILKISRKNHRGNFSFKLVGSLNLSARPALAEAIDDYLDRSRTLWLDLSEVREVDLSGVSWLMLAESRLRAAGGRLRIVAASRPVQRAMQLLNPATRILLEGHERPLPYRIQLRRPRPRRLVQAH
jgi:anti-anti-sigma factor